MSSIGKNESGFILISAKESVNITQQKSCLTQGSFPDKIL
jgi:hypothetical protein